MKKYLRWAFIGIALFGVIASTITTSWMKNLDAQAANALQGVEWVAGFHYLAETKVMIVIVLLLMVGLYVKGKHYIDMAFVFVTFAGGFILNQVAKTFFQRPRPTIENQLDSFSFPSGHAMLGCIYLVVLAMMVCKHVVAKKWHIVVMTIAILCVIMIGLSRVAESRHYITDVLAGWAFASAWLSIIVGTFKTKA